MKDHDFWTTKLMVYATNEEKGMKTDSPKVMQQMVQTMQRRHREIKLITETHTGWLYTVLYSHDSSKN